MWEEGEGAQEWLEVDQWQLQRSRPFCVGVMHVVCELCVCVCACVCMRVCTCVRACACMYVRMFPFVFYVQ